MRSAVLLVAMALLAPLVRAESIYPDADWVGPPSPTEYDLVEEADRIYLVRPAAIRGEQVRFKVEETVKGPAGKNTTWLEARAEAEEGSRYLVFLDQNEDEWTHSGLGFLEIKAEDEDWVRVLRLFAGIAVLEDDEAEAKALRELREAALNDSDRYPAALLVRMIDQHFGAPTPDKPFSDLMDLYDAAATDGERLTVLWALRYGEHPETPGFFRGLLLEGEPLWLMRPVLEWMKEGGNDVPLLKDLARVWLGHRGEDRTRLLDLMLAIAEPGDAPVLWSLLPAADMAEQTELAGHVLGGKEPDPFVDGLRLAPDEPLTADLFLLWLGRNISPPQARVRLEALLRQGETRDWRPAGLEELLSAFETSREPAERREILMEVARRLNQEGVEEEQALAVLWRLLRQASTREAEGLLLIVYDLVAGEESLVPLYRAVSGEEEKNRALWLVFAAEGEAEVEPLLAAAGALGEGSVRLERVARAFLTCPSEEARLRVVGHFEEELATAGDFLTMLKVLEGASLAEARVLAPWFIRNPGPEALSILWRLPIPSLDEDPELAQALAASGDPEVLDLALDLRRRPTTGDDDWAFGVLARSPLPAAVEEARRILEEGGHARLQLMWEVGEEDNASPWREWYLQEIAGSETVDEVTRENALTYLERLSEDEEE